MGYGLGVDLGTTFTAAAVRTKGPDGPVEVVRLGTRRAEIPSLVFVEEDGSVLVGEAAERRGVAAPERLAREFKRRVGDPVPVLVGGAPFSAHALMARLLQEVTAAVTLRRGGPPSSVTVTHPANWGAYKRELLEQAVRLADLEGVRLVPEPQAAAVQLATGAELGEGAVVAVYDLGGGTFDAAVLRRTADGFALLGEPEGIEQLGGIDIDEAVLGHVRDGLGGALDGLDPEDPDVAAALARLRRDCVEAKEALSFDTEVTIPVALPGLHTHVRLNRSELESMITPALRETVASMRRALRSAGVEPSDLASVILAGGSSRIPLVSQLISAELGRPVVLDPHPEHSVALGAARLTGAPTLVTGGVATQAPATVLGDGRGRWPGSLRRPPVRVAAPALAAVTVAALVGGVWWSSGDPPGAGAAPGAVGAPTAPTGATGTSAGSPGASGTAGGSASASPTGTPTPACGHSDDFTATSLAADWEQVAGKGRPRLLGGSLEFTAQDGADIYPTSLTAPMLLQVPRGDFVIEADVAVDPRQFYQGAGLVLWSDSTTYVRLERGYGDVGAIVFEYRDGGRHVKVKPPNRTSPEVIRTDASRVVLELSKTATTVSARWRPFDDPAWREVGSVDVDLPSGTKAGIALLNRAQGEQARPKAMTARFEYVRVTCP